MEEEILIFEVDFVKADDLSKVKFSAALKDEYRLWWHVTTEQHQWHSGRGRTGYGV